MRRAYIMLFIAAVIFQTGTLFAGHQHDKATEPSASADTVETKNYVCPMHSDTQSSKPGQCPKCGMTLKQAVHEDRSDEDSHKGHAHEHHQ